MLLEARTLQAQRLPSLNSRRSKSGNLPGWRLAGIKQLAFVGSSSSLHSEAGGSDGVIKSRISGRVRANTNKGGQEDVAVVTVPGAVPVRTATAATSLKSYDERTSW